MAVMLLCYNTFVLIKEEKFEKLIEYVGGKYIEKENFINFNDMYCGIVCNRDTISCISR